MELDLGFLTTVVIAGLGVTYILFIAASVTREEMSIHDLRVNSHKLRNAYAQKLARLRGEDDITMVDIVDEDGEADARGAEVEAA